MSRKFTSQDIDRLLGLADQFLEDWQHGLDEATYYEGKDDDISECRERRAEFDAVRPLLIMLPDLLDALDQAFGMMRQYDELVERNTLDEEDEREEWNRVHDLCDGLLGKVGAT
jgi:hypothetical protein